MAILCPCVKQSSTEGKIEPVFFSSFIAGTHGAILLRLQFQLPGGCARPQVMESRSTCSKPRVRCPYHGSTAMLSSASSGSGPGALCVHMYVFAGVTAMVRRKIPHEEAGTTHSGVSMGRSAEAIPRPPRISATPVQLT